MNKDLRKEFAEQLLIKAEGGIESLNGIEITSKDYGMVTMNISNSIAIANELKAQIEYDEEMSKDNVKVKVQEPIPKEALDRLLNAEPVEMGITKEEGDVK